MPTHTKENYLKALYHLQNKNDKITVTDLSKVLNVSKPSANNMIKKLEEKKWVKYERYQPIELTNTGKNQAKKVIRKHRLAEMFLTQFMHFGWEEVHDIAEELEHVNSEDFFDKMDELLGFPEVDPHGSPIPTKDGSIKQRKLIPLSEVKENNKVIIEALSDSNKDFLLFLGKKKLHLGSELITGSTESYDLSREVFYNKKKHVFSKEVCENLLVRVL